MGLTATLNMPKSSAPTASNHGSRCCRVRSWLDRFRSDYLPGCNLQNEQCFTGTAIRSESPHIDRVCRGFFTSYVCSGFVQKLEIVANQSKIDGFGVALKLNRDTCVRKP